MTGGFHGHGGYPTTMDGFCERDNPNPRMIFLGDSPMTYQSSRNEWYRIPRIPMIGRSAMYVSISNGYERDGDESAEKFSWLG